MSRRVPFVLALAAAIAPMLAPGQNAATPEPSLTGVWMGFKQLYGSGPDPRWYTFFDDGLVFEDIPLAGLAGFNGNASRADPNTRKYWGGYRFGNGVGLILTPGVTARTNIRAVTPDQIKLDNDVFYRCAKVDGLRLQGAWTIYANPNDPDLDRQPVGSRPVFRFTREGRFADEGVFATFLHSYGDPGQDRAGAGSYEIHDFTLILRYQDGRVKQIALTGLLGANPAVQSDVLYISRSRFRVRK